MRVSNYLFGAAAAASLFILGCDQQQGTRTKASGNAPGTAAPQPTLVASTSEPATSPASTKPAPAFIWIDQKPYEFPAARIVMKNKDDQIVAQLFSSDPPDAIDENYHGNNFYFEFTPDLPEAGTIAGASWDFKAPNSDRVDTTSGIFLDGGKKHLQPFDVHIEINGVTSPITVLLSGNFLMFDKDEENVPGKLVSVRSELLTDVKAKAAAKQ